MTPLERKIIERGYVVLNTTKAHAMDAPVAIKYTIVAFCHKGKSVFEINGRVHEMVPGTRTCFTQVTSLGRVKCSDDYEALVLVIDEPFFFNSTVGVEVHLLQMLFSNPVLPVSDGTSSAVEHLMRAIQSYQDLPTTSHTIDVSVSLVRSIMVLLAEDTLHNVSPGTSIERYTAADNYLRDFITMVRLNIKKEHEVGFYAEQLHITPKYLNEVCKRKTGHKAKEIISGMLLQQLKVAILVSGKSVKEIAYEYGFADQSSMGKFFRKLTGRSPVVFRQK